MALRDYQERGINDIRAQFSQGNKSVCLVAPCGAGKTKMMEFMSTRAAEKGNRTMFIVHRQELLDQAVKTFTESGIRVGVIAAGTPGRDLPIQVASVQTLGRRLDRIEEPDVIILDECHHATARTWRTVIDSFPNAFVVGLTATPARLGGQGLGDVFQSLVIGPSAKELIQQGHLTPYKYYAPPMAVDLTGIKTKMGDFDSAEMAKRIDKPHITGDAVTHYAALATGKRAIVYCASVDHSKNVAASFSAAGFNALHIDGETPREARKQAISDFREGRITVLCNVDLISEGFDVPSMECVILLRPTQSLTMYIQQAMRPLRPDKLNPFKQAIILDHVGNVFRHGMPDDDREWSLEGVKKRTKGEASNFNIRQCLGCYRVHLPAPVCPYCGYVYPVESREIKQTTGELAEIKEIERKQKWKELNMCKTMAELKEYADAHGYNKGWIWHRAKAKGIKS